MLILKAPSKEIKIPKNMASYFTILVERWKKHVFLSQKQNILVIEKIVYLVLFLNELH